MGRDTQYGDFVRQALCSIAAEIPPQEGIRTELVFDVEHGHYEILEVGWDGPRRIHGSLVHCDIIDGKIYVEHDGTDMGVADMLLASGVPHDDIVLGFHPPELRKLTPFAVA
jgi:hypothetical protein